MSEDKTKTRIEVNTESGIELTWYSRRCRFGILFDEKLDRDTGWWFVSEGCDKKLDEAQDGNLPNELIEVLRVGYDAQNRIAELERHNELLRDACEDALLKLEDDYSTFDFDAWRKRWTNDGGLHFCEKLMNKLKAAIDGGALDKDGEE